MADKRSYTAGHFHFTCGDQDCAVSDVDGGTASGEVVTILSGPFKTGLKHISNLKFDDITVSLGASMSKSMYDWIDASMKNETTRMSGAITSASYDYKAMQVMSYFDGLITEIGFPKLDASSKDTAKITVKFAPEKVEYADGDGSDIKGALSSKQKVWMTSNFKLEIADLPCGRVNSIDALTIKQTVVQDDIGEQRIALKEPGKLEMPASFKVTFSAADAKPWRDWFNEFCIKGAGTDDPIEKNAVISYLGLNGEVLGTLEVLNCGIFKLTNDKADSTTDKIARCTAEMYCEGIVYKPTHVG
jgi:hypothetical protein